MLILDDPKAIKAFLEYDQRELTDEEKQSLAEASAYFKSHDPFCQHCSCAICRDTGQCEKCGEHTR